MKWDKIKENCIRCSYNTITVDSGRFVLSGLEMILKKEVLLNSYKRKDAIHDEIAKIISNWDIRNFESLRKIFPNEFPKGNLRIEYNEFWEVLNR